MILLDTCIIIWDALQPDRITREARSAINQAEKNHTLIISDISLWEISMLTMKKRIQIDATPTKFLNLFLQSRSISIQSITPEIAELSVSFDSKINNDPADRIIAATSIVCNAPLVTADQNLIKSDLIKTIW